MLRHGTLVLIYCKPIISRGPPVLMHFPFKGAVWEGRISKGTASLANDCLSSMAWQLIGMRETVESCPGRPGLMS